MKEEIQTYPQFETDLLITVEKLFPKIYIDKIFVEKLGKIKLTIEVQEIDIENSYSTGEWISSPSYLNLYISDEFIQKHFMSNSEDVKVFLDKFKNLLIPIAKISTEVKKSNVFKKARPLTIFSTFYKSKDNFIFQYLFDFVGDEVEYIIAIEEVFKTIVLYNGKSANQFQKAIKRSYSQSNYKKYLLYVDKHWNVLNPLLEVSREINKRYRKHKDFRIKKPHIIMHCNDYSKYFVLDRNWVLIFDDLETLMIEPNDVSLYSNISYTSLQKAKDFFNDTITPRYKNFSGSFPLVDQQSEYYDYFELIITALIFAYTSLEAFANICIPDRYEYLIESNGVKTIYSKTAIERKFTLREKFKTILRAILKTPDPTKEKWWNTFIDLEKLRDEIIHTKQSKSVERYSKLLSNKIFKIIEVHKQIIKFYGYHIAESKTELLEEFPYNYGYDDFFPGLTDEEGYESNYRVMRNLPKKNDSN